MVDRLHDKWEAAGPVIAAPSQQPDAHRIAPGHERVAVVLDLVNPVCTGWGLVGGRRQAGSDEAGWAGSSTRAQRGHGRDHRREKPKMGVLTVSSLCGR